MKSKSLLFSLFIVTCSLFIACSNPTGNGDPPPTDTVAVTGVSLNKDTLSIAVGDPTTTLIATVAPTNATNKAVTWSSSNTAVATVSNGTVTAGNAGTATITVTTTDGSKTATCAVTVTDPVKTTPTVTTWPTAATIIYGAALSTSNLAGGAANVGGTFAWTTLTTIPTVTNSGYSVTFTPTDTANYNPVTKNDVAITVNKKALTIATATHTRAYDGSTTASGVTITLSGIVSGDTVIPGTVTAVYTAAAAGTTTINITGVTLTGASAGNYTVTPANGITVAGITKATPSGTWPSGLTATVGQTLANISLTSYTSLGSVEGAFTWTTPSTPVGAAGTRTHSMTFTPTPTAAANYNTAIKNDVAITVNAAASPTVDITGKTVAEIKTAIEAGLNSGIDVTVTGTVTGITESLSLVVPAGRKVIWEAANYTSTSNISISGTGDFVIASGARIESSINGYVIGTGSGTGRTIVKGTIIATVGGGTGVASSARTIIVDGGTITAGGNAIQVFGTAKAIINSGTLTSTGRNAIRVGGTAKLAIFGGTVSGVFGPTTGIITAAATSTVYVAGGTIPDNAIENEEGTATGYYAAGYLAKFRQAPMTLPFTPVTNLFEETPSPIWW